MKKIFLLVIILASLIRAKTQTCPTSGSTAVGANPNTYYPGTQASVVVGASSIVIGAASSGTTPISAGDIVLIIQMQGAEIDFSNNDSYGDGVAGGNGSGYLNNANHLAGNMEFAVAANAVPLAGGTLNITGATIRAYANSNFGSFGQYRYQVIRVPVYFDANLTANISTPSWNGTTGGVVAIQVRNNFAFAGFTLGASGSGFRGGGGRQLAGAGSGANTDYLSLASLDVNGNKGEGTAGTPRFLNNGGTLLDNILEGYPSGSHARGAPGNAGGGGTDGLILTNENNSGGAGGGNGGIGGRGGNTWSNNLAVGGEPGSGFAQNSASRAVMGGGGGSGTTNNATGTPGLGFASSGGAGGGIVILIAKNVVSAGTINVNAADVNQTVQNDGGGGGGAGGSVLVFANTGANNITATANGAAGGNVNFIQHGPGGGGGGGVIYANATLNVASSATGGSNGFANGPDAYGSTSGASGVIVQNAVNSAYPANSNVCLVLPATLISFTANKQNESVVLRWITTNEAKVKAYVLEKSIDGVNYTSIGTVSASRLPAAQNKYEYRDNQISSSRNFYRLKIVDADDAFSYSNIVLFKEALINEKGISIYPNPVVSNSAKLILPQELLYKKLSIRIIASDGKTLAFQRQLSNTNVLSLEFNGTMKGIVLIQVMAEGEKTVYSCKSLLK